MSASFPHTSEVACGIFLVCCSFYLHWTRGRFDSSLCLCLRLRLRLRLCLCASQLMMPPHNYCSRSSSSGVSYPMTLKSGKLCHRHIALLAAPHRHNPLTLLRFAAPAAPAMLKTATSTLRLHMSYCSHHRVSRSMPVNMPHMVYLVKRHRCDLVCVHLSQSRPHSLLLVPSMWEHIMRVQPLTAREVLVLPWRGTHNPVDTDPRAGTGLFPKPRALVLPIVKFGKSKPDGLGYIDTVDSNLMHHQYRLSVLQWSPGLARRHPTNITAAACGKFHAVILLEASDHVPHISDQFIAYTGNTDLAILLNKDTFEPDPMVFAFKEDSTNKGNWGMVLLIVRGLLRRPSLSGTPTVTFCSVHIHNVVAKKRDASTDLLRRLHGYMKQHNVDFIGGDFNMSAFSTVGDVFSDTEFAAPGNSFLWGLGALEEQYRECTGFLIIPKRPHEWRVDSHGCCKFENATLGLGAPRSNRSLSCVSPPSHPNLPGPNSIMRSEQAQQRRFERRHNKHERMRRRRT